MSRDHFPHPLTRASTAQESEPVLTPPDITPGYDFKTGFAGHLVPTIRQQRSMCSSTGAGSSYFNGIPDGLHAIREDGQYDPEPYGPYFSLPIDPTSNAPSLTRRGTTKELISRFESLESGRAMSSCSTTPSSSSVPSTPRGSEKKKGRSPIRQSFRNLISAIGKKAKGFGQAHSTTSSPKPSLSICLDSPPLPPLVKEYQSSGTYLDIPSPRSNESKISPSMPACITPTALHTGSLLYLSKPVVDGGLPVWTDCTAILHVSHMLVTWLTPLQNPSTTMITLENCADVRSLEHLDLEASERSLLPAQSNAGELKVFELLFEGRSREKFAAYSVTGRASWVNAIW